MEFTELFTALAVVLVAILSIFGLTASWNAEYGSSLGVDEEFNGTLTRVSNILGTDFVDKGLEYGKSTQPNEGAGSDEDEQTGIIRRSLRTIGLIDDLVGLVPTLIKEGATALNVPESYWRVAVTLFWIIFAITLAYLLLLGARRLL
jgi:hypothetical protein